MDVLSATCKPIMMLITAISVGGVTTQPLGSILEAKPLHQGQKTRILGRELLSLI